MRILMVCLGNICRSPLAEGILQHKINALSLDWTVDSAGTAAYHSGEAPDPRSRSIAQAHGLNINHQRARKLSTADFSDFDHILVMDRENEMNALSMANSPDARDKVKLMLSFLPDGGPEEVPDPYYGGNDGFQLVYDLLDAATDGFIASVNHDQE
ncbi:MAG: low molecular weight protein-tyrosine-phosphatase [Bacteroidota bacterium]